MTTIYALIDPTTRELRYIGKTKGTLRQRLRQHVRDAMNGKIDIYRFRWIRKLNEAGLEPHAFSLAHADENWQAAEKFWIATARYLGFRLCNGTAGGDGIDGHRHTAETKKRMSDRAREIATPELRARRGDALKAAYRDPAVKLRLSDSLKAAFAKPEVRARLSAAQKLSCSRPEVIEKKRLVMTGREITPEHRKKISEAKRGKRLSPEAIARIAAGHIGLKHSDETKAKLSAAMTPERRKAAADRFRARNQALTAAQRQAISDRMKETWAQRRAAASEGA